MVSVIVISQGNKDAQAQEDQSQAAQAQDAGARAFIQQLSLITCNEQGRLVTPTVQSIIEPLSLLESASKGEKGESPAAKAVSTSLSHQEPLLLFSSSPFFAHASVGSYLQSSPRGGIFALCHHPDSTLLNLIDEGRLLPHQLLLCGVRIRNQTEASRLRRHSLLTFPMRVFVEEGFSETCFSIMEACRSFPSLFIVLDLSVIDPSYAPGVVNPSPGGLNSREILYLMQKLMLLPTIQGVHIINYNPAQDPNGETVRLAAALAGEIIGPLSARAYGSGG